MSNSLRAGYFCMFLSSADDSFFFKISNVLWFNSGSIGLILCMLGNCSCFYVCRLLTFFKINLSFFKKKKFRNSIRVSNGLDPDQD